MATITTTLPAASNNALVTERYIALITEQYINAKLDATRLYDYMVISRNAYRLDPSYYNQLRYIDSCTDYENAAGYRAEIKALYLEANRLATGYTR